MTNRTTAALAFALLAALAACDGSPPGESRRDQIRAEALRGDAVRFAQQASMQIAEGNYEQAGILARRAIQSDASYAGGHHMLAWAAMYQGQRTVQIVSALEAVRLAPDSATYRRTLGLVFDGAGRRRDAQEAFLAAVRLNPADTASWLDAARMAHANGDYAAADSAFGAASALDAAHFDTAAADAELWRQARAILRR